MLTLAQHYMHLRFFFFWWFLSFLGRSSLILPFPFFYFPPLFFLIVVLLKASGFMSSKLVVLRSRIIEEILLFTRIFCLSFLRFVKFCSLHRVLPSRLE